MKAPIIARSDIFHLFLDEKYYEGVMIGSSGGGVEGWNMVSFKIPHSTHVEQDGCKLSYLAFTYTDRKHLSIEDCKTNCTWHLSTSVCIHLYLPY